MVRIHVPQQHRRTVDWIDDYIDLAVVEQVAKRSSARRNHICQPRALHRRHVFKSSRLRFTGDVVKQQRTLGKRRSPVMLVHLGVDVAIDHKQVQPAIVVVVEETVTPAHERNCRLRNSDVVTHIGKARRAVVVKKHLVVVPKVRHEEIDQAIVLVIAGCDTHRRDFAPVLIQTKTGDIALIVKSPIALVDVKKDCGETEILVLVFYAGLYGYIGKRPIAVVVEQMVCLAR